MKRSTLAGLAAWFLIGVGHAYCLGTGAFQTCTDDSGNSYNVQRMGNMTIQSGTAANGQQWNQTIQTMDHLQWH